VTGIALTRSPSLTPPTVRLSKVGVLLKRLNVGSPKQLPHDSPGTL